MGMSDGDGKRIGGVGAVGIGAGQRAAPPWL